jgi:hypothetical protein
MHLLDPTGIEQLKESLKRSKSPEATLQLQLILAVCVTAISLYAEYLHFFNLETCIGKIRERT